MSKEKIVDNKKVKHNTITEAQHAVMEQIKMLDKDAEAHDFVYTSAAFALLVLRPLMLKHGISKFKVNTIPGGRWQNGIGVDYTLVYRYQLTGAETLEPGVTYQDVYVEASGKVGKSGDKSTFAAQTTGGKYADVDFFNLPMTDDIEGFEEASALLEETYNGTSGKPKKNPKKAKVEDEDDEMEIPNTSKDISYKDGVLDIIQAVFDEYGEDKLLEFVEGDTRNKVEDLVEELVGEEGDEDEEEEEVKPKKNKKKKKSSGKKTKKSKPEEEEDDEEDEEGVELDDLDYDDPKVVKALIDQIDIEDEDMIHEIITGSFTDSEALKAFYTVCVEHAGEIGAEFQEQFNETHFEALQETFEELVD